MCARVLQPSPAGGGGSPQQAAEPEPKKETPTPAPAPSSGGGGGGVAGDHGEFFHGGIKKGEADALLLADDGAEANGKFLVRSKGGSSNDFILGVVYKAAATHHVLVRPAEGEEFTLNKVPTGCTTIPEVLEKYRSKQPKWPVPLKDGVAGSGGGGGSNTPAAKKEPEPTQGQTNYSSQLVGTPSSEGDFLASVAGEWQPGDYDLEPDGQLVDTPSSEGDFLASMAGKWHPGNYDLEPGGFEY